MDIAVEEQRAVELSARLHSVPPTHRVLGKVLYPITYQAHGLTMDYPFGDLENDPYDEGMRIAPDAARRTFHDTLIESRELWSRDPQEQVVLRDVWVEYHLQAREPGSSFRRHIDWNIEILQVLRHLPWEPETFQPEWPSELYDAVYAVMCYMYDFEPSQGLR